jgi:carbon-monoxide dehydrogenase medium subunit
MMKLRIAAPSKLVDLRRVPGCTACRAGRAFRIGAMTPHAVRAHARARAAREAASTIADPQVRHIGTIGGSLAHGDPASDLPAVLLAAEAHGDAAGRRAARALGRRRRLFVDYLTTAVQGRRGAHRGPDAGARRLRLRLPEVQPPAEDWAMVAVCALVLVEDGRCATCASG